MDDYKNHQKNKTENLPYIFSLVLLQVSLRTVSQKHRPEMGSIMNPSAWKFVHESVDLGGFFLSRQAVPQRWIFSAYVEPLLSLLTGFGLQIQYWAPSLQPNIDVRCVLKVKRFALDIKQPRGRWAHSPVSLSSITVSLNESFFATSSHSLLTSITVDAGHVAAAPRAVDLVGLSPSNINISEPPRHSASNILVHESTSPHLHAPLFEVAPAEKDSGEKWKSLEKNYRKIWNKKTIDRNKNVSQKKNQPESLSEQQTCLR